MSAEADFFDFSQFFDALKANGLSAYSAEFKQILELDIDKKNGHLPEWLKLYSLLPKAKTAQLSASGDEVKIGCEGDISKKDAEKLKQILLKLDPWRKGPFDICGVKIDAEWRSNLKWQRIAPHIKSFKNKRVADIGCGNGYYMLKAGAAGARLVVGVDPTMAYYAQYKFITKYCDTAGAYLLPIKLEALPCDIKCFDIVFALGIFYHRKDPFDFLKRLKTLLVPGGTLAFETLVVEGGENTAFVPENRYARMHNIWLIPSVLAMQKWLKKAGFVDAKAVDITATTSYEQRSTEWMTGESLDKCLDKNNPSKTVEGCPAPVRAAFIASAPTA